MEAILAVLKYVFLVFGMSWSMVAFGNSEGLKTIEQMQADHRRMESQYKYSSGKYKKLVMKGFAEKAKTFNRVHLSGVMQSLSNLENATSSVSYRHYRDGTATGQAKINWEKLKTKTAGSVKAIDAVLTHFNFGKDVRKTFNFDFRPYSKWTNDEKRKYRHSGGKGAFIVTARSADGLNLFRGKHVMISAETVQTLRDWKVFPKSGKPTFNLSTNKSVTQKARRFIADIPGRVMKGTPGGFR